MIKGKPQSTTQPEMQLAFSDKFKEVLLRMGHPLAQLISDHRGIKTKSTYNYFDVADSNDMISFITTRKASEIMENPIVKYNLARRKRLLNGKNDSNKHYFDSFGIGTSRVGEMPPVGQPGTVEARIVSPKTQRTYVKFVPDNPRFATLAINMDSITETKIVDPNDFYKKHRQNIRIGRVVRPLLQAIGKSYTDQDIEQFVNKWKAAVDSINDRFYFFEEVRGEDIPKWYNFAKYEKGRTMGTLSTSCMSAVDPSFFELYQKNPDKISMVIYKSPYNPSFIKGRALVWKLDSGKFFMDRVYVHNDSDFNLFREYARKRGWWSKGNNNSGASGISIDPSDGSTMDLGNMKCSLVPSKCKSYPYLDTFKFFLPRTGEISNIQEKPYSRCILEHTNGTCYEPDRVLYVDPITGEKTEVYSGEVVWCEIGKSHRMEKDTHYSKYYRQFIDLYYAKQNMKWCESVNDWRKLPDCALIYGTDKFAPKDVVSDSLNFSFKHDMFIQKEDSVYVFTHARLIGGQPSGVGFDIRSKGDGTWFEFGGKFYDISLVNSSVFRGLKS